MSNLIYSNLKSAVLPSLWKHLPYEDLIKYCQTNKEYSRTCQNPSTWIYLLERDFKKSWNSVLKESPNANPRKYYELLDLMGYDPYSQEFDTLKSKPELIIAKMNQYARSQPLKPKNHEYYLVNRYVEIQAPNSASAAVKFIINEYIPSRRYRDDPNYDIIKFISENFDADIIDGHTTSVEELMEWIDKQTNSIYLYNK